MKNPVCNKFYVTNCGRYARLDQLCGKLRKQVRCGPQPTCHKVRFSFERISHELH